MRRGVVQLGNTPFQKYLTAPSAGLAAGQRKPNPLEQNRRLKITGISMAGFFLARAVMNPFRIVGLLLLAFAVERPAVAADASIYSTNLRRARKDATDALPLDQLTDEARAKIERVVSKPSFYRRISQNHMECHSDLFIFLARYPEVVVSIWDLMGITQIEITRTGPHSFTARDGQGTKSDVELVYGTRDTHLFYASAQYDGALLARPVQGKCVLLLKTGRFQDAEGRPFVSNQLDVFVRLDRIGAEVLTRTLHPLVGHITDHNFTESATFIGRLYRAAQTNGPGMQRLAQRLTDVDADVQHRFAEIAAEVSDQAAGRSVAAGSETFRALPPSGAFDSPERTSIGTATTRTRRSLLPLRK